MTSSRWPAHRAHDMCRQGRAIRSAIVALSAMCLAVGLSACGNWISPPTVVGQLGLTVDLTGQPVVAIVSCSKQTPVIYMYEGRRRSDPDSKENVQRGTWQARRAFSGVERLALATPGEMWKTTRRSGTLESDRLFLVDSGTVENDNASLGAVNFRLRDLASLSPDTVQVAGKTTSWRAFAAYTCA
jgi:hypothetical protein